MNRLSQWHRKKTAKHPIPLVSKIVARLLRQHQIHRVFVLQDQKPVGVISTSNLLDVLINACDCRATD